MCFSGFSWVFWRFGYISGVSMFTRVLNRVAVVLFELVLRLFFIVDFRDFRGLCLLYWHRCEVFMLFLLLL